MRYNASDMGVDLLVSEHEIGSVLGDIRTSHTHSDTDGSELQSGRVVDTVTRHGQMPTTSLSGVDHANLGLWSTASNDQWQLRQGVNLVVGELVELGSL